MNFVNQLIIILLISFLKYNLHYIDVQIREADKITCRFQMMTRLYNFILAEINREIILLAFLNKFTKNLRDFQNLGGLAQTIFLNVYKLNFLRFSL